ncbi:MAG: hypothetical protein HY282_04840 [Nitrospirae bacterium]|nr:hypothetical protein [Candidatus Manganitrophaceae bacterium]
MDQEAAKQIILDFYQEIGGNQHELHFASDWFSGASYKVARKGHGYKEIRRVYIDDYLDSKDKSAEVFIKGKLERLLKMEEAS